MSSGASREDRRVQPRVAVESTEGFRLRDYASGAVLLARAVDLSEGGLGVEVEHPLSSGSPVSIEGEIHSERFCVGLQGGARVAYCRLAPHGWYRIGLTFQGTGCRNLDCTHHVSAPADEPASAPAEGPEPHFWGAVQVRST